jgi:hypothetical protein
MTAPIFIYMLLSLFASLLIYSICVAAARADRTMRRTNEKSRKARVKKSPKIDIQPPTR